MERAGVDVGGTFTDVVVHHAGAPPRAVKVPTTADDQSVGVAAGLERSGTGEALTLLAHGTTTATNAVLERDVARVVLVTTRGFADVLHIARQNRPSLYDLSVTRPEPLVPRDRVVGVTERVAADGSVVVPLTDNEVDRVAGAVEALEPEAVAISLLFSYANGDHERRLAEALASLGVPVTVAHRLLPEFREYERTSTVAVNAAVAPIMRRYMTRLRRRVTGSPITVMTSGGGTVGPAFAADAPVHTLLSGPAAGVVAAGAIASSAGYPDAVAFDMGGTSTDVCLILDGVPQIVTRSEIGGLPFITPAVDIHTVGAGGGSLAWTDAGGALRVGPRSAGARPGPACYGLGGTEPTVTDAHCALGHLDVNRRLGGGLQLDAGAADKALARLPPDAGGAHGVLTVVRATMLRALRRVTTESGVDPDRLALVAYGGAGPLHATALAEQLGCRAVIIPPAPGVLSALGLLLAAPRYEVSRTVMRSPDDPGLQTMWADLEAGARRELDEQGVSGRVRTSLLADMRYAGQSHELRIPAGERAEDARGRGNVPDLASRFHEAHADAYGFAMRGEPVVVVTLRAIAEGQPTLEAPPASWDQGPAFEPYEREIGVSEPDGTGVGVPGRIVSRAGLATADMIEGPALVEQSDSTTLLAPGQVAVVDEHHNLVVRLSNGAAA